VLVADDEARLADLYTEYLDSEYEILTAYSGEEALEILETREDVDVALLDRRMPDLSGDKVLAKVREAGVECRIALVTAVNPDFDIIDMGCDAYVIKPVSQSELLDVVERLRKLSAFSEKHQRLTSKKLTRNVLRLEKDDGELANSSRYERLQAEIEDLEDDLEDIGEGLALEDVQRHI
jgi:DNA-binding response OmpR family regulator